MTLNLDQIQINFVCLWLVSEESVWISETYFVGSVKLCSHCSFLFQKTLRETSVKYFINVNIFIIISSNIHTKGKLMCTFVFMYVFLLWTKCSYVTNGYFQTPVIRERRRFTDVMDEEIDDERKERINQYGSSEVYSLRRLRHELGTRLDGHAEAEAMIEYKREGQVEKMCTHVYCLVF